jgi:hypothetical protein
VGKGKSGAVTFCVTAARFTRRLSTSRMIWRSSRTAARTRRAGRRSRRAMSAALSPSASNASRLVSPRRAATWWHRPSWMRACTAAVSGARSVPLRDTTRCRRRRDRPCMRRTRVLTHARASWGAENRGVSVRYSTQRLWQMSSSSAQPRQSREDTSSRTAPGASAEKGQLGSGRGQDDRLARSPEAGQASINTASSIHDPIYWILDHILDRVANTDVRFAYPLGENGLSAHHCSPKRRYNS